MTKSTPATGWGIKRFRRTGTIPGDNSPEWMLSALSSDPLCFAERAAAEALAQLWMKDPYRSPNVFYLAQPFDPFEGLT